MKDDDDLAIKRGRLLACRKTSLRYKIGFEFRCCRTRASSQSTAEVSLPRLPLSASGSKCSTIGSSSYPKLDEDVVDCRAMVLVFVLN